MPMRCMASLLLLSFVLCIGKHSKAKALYTQSNQTYESDREHHLRSCEHCSLGNLTEIAAIISPRLSEPVLRRKIMEVKKLSAKQHSQMLPKFKAVPNAKSREIGFVHVTKTGGTAVKDHMLIHRSECPKVKFTSGHLDLEKDWQRKGYQSLVVLRDPVDRFRSAFDYAKYGSGFHGGYHSTAAGLFADANSFAHALRDDKHVHHKQAWDTINHREGGVQFQRAAAWLNGSPSKRTVVCYSHDLGMGISNQVNKHTGDSSCKISIPRVNVSRKKSAALTKENANWVKKRYKADYDLYTSHCS